MNYNPCAPSAPPAEEMPEMSDARLDHIPYAIPIDVVEQHPAPSAPPSDADAPASHLPLGLSPAFVNSLHLGEWKSPGDDPFNALMASCLPCFPLAQVAHRIGWGNYWKVLLTLLGLYAAEILFQIYTPTTVRTKWWIHYAQQTKPRHNATHTYTWELMFDHKLDTHDETLRQVVACLFDVLTQLTSYTGLVIIVLTLILRRAVRVRYALCGWIICDVCASVLCTCCTIAQLTVQTETFTPDKWSIGPPDTLPPYEPE